MCLNESIVENTALTWFGQLDYEPHMAPDEATQICDDVFGLPPRISIPSSPNLDLSSLNLDAKIDTDGCLIEGQLTLPLSGKLSVAAATCKDYLQVQRANIVGLKGK